MTPAPPMPSSSSLVSLVDETPPLRRSQRKRSTPNVAHESEEKVLISVSYDVIFQKSRRSTKSKSSKSPATPKNVMSMCYNLRRSSKHANDVYGDEQGELLYVFYANFDLIQAHQAQAPESSSTAQNCHPRRSSRRTPGTIARLSRERSCLGDIL